MSALKTDFAGTMAGRRGCVNSLWSGSDRVRIGERLKATLAGIMELDLLRGRQLEMVDAVLDVNEAPAHQGEGLESAAEDGAATSRRQQVSGDVGKYHRNIMFLVIVTLVSSSRWNPAGGGTC